MKRRVVFLTFGTEEIKGSRTRLKYRAIETGWFDEVYSIDETSIQDDVFLSMKSLHWNEDYHGFYFFKPFAISSILEKLNEGDILVYADAACDINLDGKRFLDKKLGLLSPDEYCMVAYGATSIGAFSSSEAISKILKMERQRIPETVLAYPQIQTSILYIMKNSASMKIIEEWKRCECEYYASLKMSYDAIRDEWNPRFIQNRNDQTSLGLLAYKYKDIVKLLKPDYDWLDAPHLSQLEIRLSKNDILPCRKKFAYKPYVMFVAGHVIPQNEKYFDSYTHFIDVGNHDLERCVSTTGDNIGDLGDVAELTALYYIWKNIDLSDVTYVGFSTYRKPFQWNNGKLYECLENGQECIANKFYQHRKNEHLRALDEKVINDFRDFFKSVYPDDYDAFCQHQECGYIYPCNSFVMKTPDFHKLCEYIFSVLIPYAKKTKGCHGRTTHSPYAGVFGEDLTSFFIAKTFQKIQSVPFLVYPYYRRYYNFDLAYQLPLLWGTVMNGNEELFFPCCEQNAIQPRIQISFKAQIKGKNEFYEENGQPQERRILLGPKYNVQHQPNGN